MVRMRTLALVALMLVAAGCGSMNRATPAEWDDTAIKADVKSKIAAIDPGKALDIGVEVDDGVVTLNGEVSSADMVRRIGDAANSVSGVKRMVNNIQVR